MDSNSKGSKTNDRGVEVCVVCCVVLSGMRSRGGICTVGIVDTEEGSKRICMQVDETDRKRSIVCRRRW